MPSGSVQQARSRKSDDAHDLNVSRPLTVVVSFCFMPTQRSLCSDCDEWFLPRKQGKGIAKTLRFPPLALLFYDMKCRDNILKTAFINQR